MYSHFLMSLNNNLMKMGNNNPYCYIRIYAKTNKFKCI